jgi:hypothetical protein
MNALDAAIEHHLNGCLDNHTEENCVAVRLARVLSLVQNHSKAVHLIVDNATEKVLHDEGA